MTRPEFHFTVESGWINDPHGITYRDGEYHSFFQYVPDSMVWAPNCHWGHAKGRDLFSLKELPVAIAPGEGDDGIWTGALVTDDADATRIFYTSTAQPDIGMGRVRIATPDDDEWISWSKGAFVADAPTELDIIAYRDPFIIREGDGWRMFLGAGLRDGTATALSYRSTDLESWTYEGIALQRSTNEREPVWMGALWECPQIIDVDGRAVMVSSVWEADILHYAGYALGRYADGRFNADAWGQLTYGPSYYAPSAFRDADGRWNLSFWMRGVRDDEAGWSSAHSVPHVLGLVGDHLAAAPHPDLEFYRREPVADGALPGLAGDALWSASAGNVLEITSADEMVLRIVADDGSVSIESPGERWEMPVHGDLRVILDARTVEISSPGGIFGLAVHPNGDRYTVNAVSGSATVWPLAR